MLFLSYLRRVAYALAGCGELLLAQLALPFELGELGLFGEDLVLALLDGRGGFHVECVRWWFCGVWCSDGEVGWLAV